MIIIKNEFIYLQAAFMCFYFSTGESPSTPAWSWKCVKDGEGNQRCIRERATSIPTPPISSTTCHMTCDPAATLVPKPQNVHLSKEVVSFIPSNLRYSMTSCPYNICQMLLEAFQIMKTTILKYHPQFGEKESLWDGPRGNTISEHVLTVQFFVSGEEDRLTLDTNESYTLRITTDDKMTTVVVKAPSYFGARHALETLSQLIDYDKNNNALQIISSGSIEDYPRFRYRGLSFDTSRNFYPIKVLKRVIDGMSYNKLNYFHWHISDTQAFPLVIKQYPKMSSYGAYSPEKVYTHEDVMYIVQYAQKRGIRVIPELDAPSHVGNGWDWGEEEGLGPLVVCFDKKPWNKYCFEPPCGQMNLANENVYKVLGNVYKEMIQMFGPIEMFHYGGDEVQLNCWNTSSEMTEWMTAQGYGLQDEDYYNQWGIFQEKARRLMTAANGGTEVPGIMWTSRLTAEGRVDRYLDKDKYIIQVWSEKTNPSIKYLLEKEYRVIFSNKDALYLDYGVSSWMDTGPNSRLPYNGWQDIYDNDILNLVRNLTGSDMHDKQVLGGEAALWSEQIDENTIDSKLWPRGAAHAERLWTNPKTNYSFAEIRMLHHRQRLVQRGLQADRLQPEWCDQNEGQCRRPWKPKKQDLLEEEEFSSFTVGPDSGSLASNSQILYLTKDQAEFFLWSISVFNLGAFVILAGFSFYLRISIFDLIRSIFLGCIWSVKTRKYLFICIIIFITVIFFTYQPI